MWPAVPRIIGGSALPPLLFPQLEGAQGTPISEMLGEELAKQPLVGARRGVVERRALLSADEPAHRVAGFRRQLAPRRCEPSTPCAERATRAVAEHHRRRWGQRRLTIPAHVRRL